jgi:hypothetical protein
MAKTFIGVFLMAIAARAGAAHESLHVGQQLPTLAGQFLTGRPATLPQASAGRVTLIALGFTYASRVPVEAWGGWYRTEIGSRTDVTFFEIPMIGGVAKLGRWFIDRGMRNGMACSTPLDLRS